MRLTQALVGPVRTKMLADQGGVCLLCRRPIKNGQGTDGVLDHDHGSGHVRGVLHRGCNAMLGHLENNRPRHLLTDDDKFSAFLSNIMPYLLGDYAQNPQYPTHKSEEEKKVAAANRRRKKALAEKLAAANPEQAAAMKAKNVALRTARALRNRPKVKVEDNE